MYFPRLSGTPAETAPCFTSHETKQNHHRQTMDGYLRISCAHLTSYRQRGVFDHHVEKVDPYVKRRNDRINLGGICRGVEISATFVAARRRIFLRREHTREDINILHDETSAERPPTIQKERKRKNFLWQNLTSLCRTLQRAEAYFKSDISTVV